MLTSLRIQNLALVESLEVAFRAGLNVVTGETGAGKSMLLDAIQLVLGGRAQADLIRRGADELVVEAHFEGPSLDARLESLGLDAGGGELLVRRVVQRNGRGKVTVNGQLCTVGMLGQLGRGLVDLSGQHEHVTLLEPATHLALLDAFGGLEPARAAYEALHGRWREALRARAEGVGDPAERGRRADYLAFQIREITEVAPEAGEASRLAEQRKRLASTERLRSWGTQALELLQAGEEPVADRIGRALARMHDAALLDPALEATLQGFRAAAGELEEAQRGLSRYLDGLDAEPERLAAIDERLDGIKRLARKHGVEPDLLHARAEAMQTELDALTHHEARQRELDAEITARREAAVAEGQRLSKRRHEAAARFGSAVQRELGRLALGQMRFELRVSPSGEPGPSGLDGAEMHVGPNPGEPMAPLATTGSGGELSRVLLAVKRALAEADPVDVYVFDEVDTGLGGEVAEAVGQALADVGKRRQVLCVTHLAPVAAHADHHLVVEKRVAKGRTQSLVRPLEGLEARGAELARMLGGATGPTALAHARTLLDSARGAAPTRPLRSVRGGLAATG